MREKKSFISYLATDDFLPGILVLHESLKNHNPHIPFLVITSDEVSSDTIKLLNYLSIPSKQVAPVNNPNPIINVNRNFRVTYTKLRIFELTEFSKIVYLDADMIVLGNIENLFHAPHMSAVIAGGFLPKNHSWEDLNSGLLVIEPDQRLFNRMIMQIDKLSSIDGGDQGFLQSFFPEWPTEKHKHLDHKYNIPTQYVDSYCHLNNCSLAERSDKILIIHYWAYYKPWKYKQPENNRYHYREAICIWIKHYDMIIESLSKKNIIGGIYDYLNRIHEIIHQ
ncbi:glycosyltransferase [Chitinophaga arvensicola]|uniref:Glycosyl transferase family 8 n=1 Tax=Chitinophaga arvensicola TaxID=29529 RepID=A0A1I0S8G0_9BACT|nr:glycosyltransferase [Chitinophaga arvensicola]SEW52328.1 Glycosyl transferase family 8 [Chitinophaga arvensicola]